MYFFNGSKSYPPPFLGDKPNIRRTKMDFSAGRASSWEVRRWRGEAKKASCRSGLIWLIRPSSKDSKIESLELDGLPPEWSTRLSSEVLNNIIWKKSYWEMRSVMLYNFNNHRITKIKRTGLILKANNVMYLNYICIYFMTRKIKRRFNVTWYAICLHFNKLDLFVLSRKIV